jgi:hypothetical protein
VCACGFGHGFFVAAGEFGFFSTIKKNHEKMRFFPFVQNVPPFFAKEG